MGSNISNELFNGVNDCCMSEGQQYVLFMLLMTNILLLITFMKLPQRLAGALHRKQPPAVDVEVSSPNSTIKKREITSIRALPKKVASFVSIRISIAAKHIGNIRNLKNSADSEDLEKQVANQWYCVGASVQGTSHENVGLPCQDMHRYQHLRNGDLIMAVADGVGSAQRSDEGAKLACDVAINYLSTHLEQNSTSSEEELENAIRNAYQSAVDSIRERAGTSGASMSEYATTLSVAVVTDELVIGAMVGDGMMVVEDSQGEFGCFFALPKREYANQVVSITSAQGPAELQIVSRSSPIKTVALLTDGLLRLSCDVRKNVPHPPFFQMMTSLLYKVPEHHQASKELEVLLNHPSINERTDDDKTLVVAANIRLGAREEGRSDDL